MRSRQRSLHRPARVALGDQLRRYGPLLAAGAAATGSIAILHALAPADTRRFMGDLPPTAVTGAACILGIVGLETARRRGFWSDPDSRRLRNGLVAATAAAVPLAGIAIAADLIGGFPADMNVEFPRSLAFYPTIAIVAESLFHAIPLGIVVVVTGWRYPVGSRVDRRVVTTIGLVALVEPIAQAVLGSSMLAFVGPHVWLIGIVQLALLRWAGYVPMLWFRIAYYALWHVLWGALR